MKRPARTHPLWLAYILHRLSGLVLAIFLPIHFWVLSMALTDTARLDQALRYTELPLVKFAEFAVHCFGGLRLLAMEWLPWNARQKNWAAGAVAGSFLIATLFLLKAI